MMKSLYVFVIAATTITVTAAALAGEPYFPRSEKSFLKLDTNKDGLLKTDEFTPVSDRSMAGMDGNGDKLITSAEIDAQLSKSIERRRLRLMQLLDANKDGSITQAEFDHVVNDMFDKADADNNGGVDFAELRAFKRTTWRKALVAANGGTN